MAVRIIFVDDDGIEIPSLVGLNATDAAAILQTGGFMARVDRIESDQPEGIVVAQTPSVGEKAQKGKIVVLRVSKGGTKYLIPDVRGKAFAAAVKELDAAGFKIGNVIKVPDAIKAPGTVIAQNPASPSSVPSDRMVELLVSEGGADRSEMIQVPDLRGQSERMARQILEQSSLAVSKVITVESNQVPDGTVQRTQPIAGSRVPGGNAIVLYIAKNFEETTPAVTETATSTSAPNAPPQTSPAQQTANAPVPSQQSTTLPKPDTSNTTVYQPQTQTQPPASAPAAAQQPQTPSQPPAAPTTPTKTAKIRYQVPPLSRPLLFKVSITDTNGTRVLRNNEAKGGEFFSMDIGYTGEANVVVQLDNETVWQERYR